MDLSSSHHHDIVLTIGCLFSRDSQVADVGATGRLSNCEADLLLATEYFGHDPVEVWDTPRGKTARNDLRGSTHTLPEALDLQMPSKVALLQSMAQYSLAFFRRFLTP